MYSYSHNASWGMAVLYMYEKTYGISFESSLVNFPKESSALNIQRNVFFVPRGLWENIFYMDRLAPSSILIFIRSDKLPVSLLSTMSSADVVKSLQLSMQSGCLL